MKRLAILVVAALALGTWRNADFWSTPEQRGDRLLRAGRFADAAATYRDPVHQGVALYRADEFEKAAAAFAHGSTAEAAYDRGNALVMRGKYDDAVKSYDRALTLRPGWTDAADNRKIAIVRRDRLKFQGGDAIGGQEKPDAIVFDRTKKSQGDPADVAGGDPLSDEQIRSLWLRNVQTKPADFLRAKFAFQLQDRAKGPTP